MRESSTSLRLYFGIASVLYFLSAGFLFALMGPLGLTSAFGNLFIGSPLALINTLLNIVWSIGYIYFAFALPGYLNPKRSKYVKIFLVLPVAMMLLNAGIGFLTSGQTDFTTPIIGILITWYLYANVQRLSNPPAPAPSPVR